MPGVIRRFDTPALFRALDEERRGRGLSWKGAAGALWEQSYELNAVRGDHPISPATLTGMAKRHDTSCQHALFMLRWLERSPESFLPGGDGGDPRFRLPAAGPDRRPRWSLATLYAAMDETRGVEKLTWAALADVLGCTANQLTALRTAKFATGMRNAMTIVQWLGRPAADFVYAARW